MSSSPTWSLESTFTPHWSVESVSCGLGLGRAGLSCGWAVAARPAQPPCLCRDGPGSGAGQVLPRLGTRQSCGGSQWRQPPPRPCFCRWDILCPLQTKCCLLQAPHFSLWSLAVTSVLCAGLYVEGCCVADGDCSHERTCSSNSSRQKQEAV